MLHDQIYRETAQWIVKIQHAPLNETEQLEFEQWKQQSSQHQAAWSKAERLLYSLEEFPEDGQQLIQQGKKNAQFNLNKQLVLACLLCFGSVVLWNSDYRYIWLSDYRTAVGQQKQVELEDGTQLQLNTHTALDVRYTAQQRIVKLHYGEIQIRTAKEKNHAYRPFLVETESANLQALGTVFNVQYFNNSEKQTCLGVIESAVKVSLNQSKHTKIVHAGEQLCFDDRNFKALQSLDPNILAWKNHMVMAFEMPLEKLLQEIGRYQHQYIDIAPQLKSLKVSGSYPVNDFGTLQTALQFSYPIKVERYFGDRVLSIQPKAENQKSKNN